ERGGRGLDGRQCGRDRAQRPADRDPRDRVRCGSRRGRDRRGGYACEEVRDRGGGKARERDSGADRPGARGVSESLARVEELFARTEELRAKLEATEEPEAAHEILEQLTELLKEVELEIRKARQQAESGAGA